MAVKKQYIAKERREELREFQKKLSVRFKNLELLNTALSHKSYVNEVDEGLENNEKLEFLGDAFFGLIISDYLYGEYADASEGSLARIKSYVVSETTLHRVGRNIDIQRYLLLGKGEEKTGGRNRKALISDSVEALIGAYYLDAGYRLAQKLVVRLFRGEILNVERDRHEKDWKSILQEFAQKRFKVIPRYIVVSTEGPDHNRKFFINVTIHKKTFGPGVGASKKEAEQDAANLALRSLRQKGHRRDQSEGPPRDHKPASGKVRHFARGGKRSTHSSKDAHSRPQS